MTNSYFLFIATIISTKSTKQEKIFAIFQYICIVNKSNSIMILIPILLLILCALYHLEFKKHLIKDEISLNPFEDSCFEPLDETPTMSTIDGIGRQLIGCYRYSFDSYVSYLFFTFLFIPIFPIGCYRVTKLGTTYPSYKRTITKFQFLGKAISKKNEIADCYLSILSIYGIVASIIWLLIIVCS